MSFTFIGMKVEGCVGSGRPLVLGLFRKIDVDRRVRVRTTEGVVKGVLVLNRQGKG